MVTAARWLAAAILLACAPRPAGAQGATPSLPEELAHLEETIPYLVEMESALGARSVLMPGRMLAYWAPAEYAGVQPDVVVVGRDRLDRILDSVAKSGIRRDWVLAEIEKMTNIGRAEITAQLREKTRRREEVSRLLASGTLPWSSLWLEGTGRFDMTCRTDSGDFPSSGGAAFQVKGGAVAGSFEGGSFTGTVAEDGSASGYGKGPFGTVQWWGRFRLTSGGALAGQGSISPAAGEAQCAGTWSLP